MNEFDTQLTIWNLKVLETRLLTEQRGTDAYELRKVLDLLSPNWRDAKSYQDVTVNNPVTIPT